MREPLTDELFGGSVEGDADHGGLGVDFDPDAGAFDGPFTVFEENGGGRVATGDEGLGDRLANGVDVVG